MVSNTGLSIYKASAGSGKTFLLVGAYLKLLFAQPLAYRNVLAVTFTNKATAEMKERILKELVNLSTGKTSGYAAMLLEFGSEVFIRERAAFILKKILHDYSRFSVMTIDSFFQKIIRSFAREIRLNASFKTEIDSRQAMEDAVDLLFQEVDNNELLMNWMMLFLEENLEEGKSWDFKQELLKFGMEVEKEVFKVHGDEFLETLTGKEQLSQYINEIKEVSRQTELRLKKLGQEGIDLIASFGLNNSQFKNGNASFANIFNKLVDGKFEAPAKRALAACDNLDEWFKKTDSQHLIDQIEKVYHGGLNRLLKEAIVALDQEVIVINSAKAIVKNIYPFGLLGNIALKIKEVLGAKNTVLLSDSGRMIGRIIEGNDTPFIYEKVGLIYRHFMLDEFQDTSRQQWTNFKPLIENALASGYASMVVGDVKQSIYRWRNGDWNLLANQLAVDLGHQAIYAEPLNNNWRSAKNVVDFNNTLFWHASHHMNSWFEGETEEIQFSDLHGVIKNAYTAHYQRCALTGKSEGAVKMLFVESDGSKSKNAFREKAMVLLVAELERVQQLGVKAEDIAILVRENAEAGKIANALWERKKTAAIPGCIYDVITSDTLRIGQSKVVGFVVNFFQFFIRKDPKPVRAEILYNYYRILLPMRMGLEEDAQIDLHELFDSEAVLPELFRQWLDEDPQSEFLTGLLAQPLYELAVSVVDHFFLGEITGEKVYLQAFLDMVLEYGREDCGGIPGFLEWWEAIGCSKTLNLSNVKNFIRISSIHQSKGLEFPTVFIPFCNWEIGLNTHKLPYVWSFPETEPFDRLKMVLLKCESSLKNSIFAYDYYRELLYCIMDNLNLLYVATTRAINNLVFILPYKEGVQTAGNVAELIQMLMERPFSGDAVDQEKFRNFGECWDPVNKIFMLGSIKKPIQMDAVPVQELPNEPLALSPNNRMKIRLHSKDYFQLSGDSKQERISKGTIMHRLFEKIKTRNDIGIAVNQMVAEGSLTTSEGEDFFLKIDGLLRQVPFAEWFSGQWKVLNERDILRKEESRHRPDRVMLQGNRVVVIDYKTGEASDKDIRQMKGYLDDLQKMGYVSCKGNIWYLQNNLVIQVNTDK